MWHPDEHTIEQFILNSPAFGARREDIQRHLDECTGCRRIADEIAGFYASFGQELEQLGSTPVSDQTALIRKGGSMTIRERGALRQVQFRELTWRSRFFSVARSHPVLVSVGGVGATALFALAAVLFFLRTPAPVVDPEPASHFLNEATGMLEIYNSSGTRLWETPAYDLTAAKQAERQGGILKCTESDLDGDGVNEVITTLELPDEEPNRGGFLKIYRWDHSVLTRHSMDRNVQYLNRTYDPQFVPSCLLVLGKQELSERIVLVASGNTRSPSYLAAVTSQGETVGEYWHFGHIGLIYRHDLLPSGNEEVIAFGINDVLDKTHEEFPVLIVLDPQRIRGVKKSTTTPGFDLPESQAELFYIRLPESDLDRLFGVHPGTSHAEFESRDHLFVTLVTVAGDISYMFTYVFDASMRIVQVKSNNATDKLHGNLVSEGKLQHPLDDAYLSDLGKEVRYWNGLTWENFPAKVRHASGDDAVQ